MKPPENEGDIERRIERERLRELLRDRVEPMAGPFFRRIRKCGDELKLRCVDCKRGRKINARCKWKCCPVCQHAVTAASAARFTKIASLSQWPLMVTLTAAHTVDDGVSTFREMRKALVRLRAQRWWKQRVKGGVACWEVSRLNKRDRKRLKLGKDQGWHFHCHMLLDCKWLYVTTSPPGQFISTQARNARILAINAEVIAQWELALGGRKGGLDVRRVWRANGGGIEGAVHEIVKYAMTGAQLAESEWDIEPVLWALEKARMIQGFGTFYRHPDIKRETRAPSMCECGCSSWDFRTDTADRLEVEEAATRRRKFIMRPK